jgi:NitT/TauT family transport system substrate-binding protein
LLLAGRAFPSQHERFAHSWELAIMMKRMALAGLALLIGTLNCGVVRAADAVTLRLKWFNQAQFAGFYVAKEKAYYQSAGLNVDIQAGGPDFPAIQMVAGGNEQFGVASADQILIARSKGVPVVALAVIYRRSPFVLFALKQSGIDDPAAFKGKRIGVKLGGNEELVYRALLAKAGVNKTDVTEIPVKFDITPLLTNAVDVWPGYAINEVIAVREKGFEVNIISPASFGVDLYADTLFTTEKMLSEKPGIVGAFVVATLKGWRDAIASPEEAAKTTLKYGVKLTYEHELAMMKASIPSLVPDSKPVGSMDEVAWRAAQDLLVAGGFQRERVDLAKVYTTKFLEP